MANKSVNGGEVYVDCSDNENYGFEFKDGKWLPPPNDLESLFEALDRQENLELEWQCPGRRPSTPTKTPQQNQSLDENIDDDEKMDKSDFDFQEDMSHLNLSVRPTGGNTPKGSAKKKTTTFHAVLSNMARHRKLNMIPDQVANNSNENKNNS